MGGGTDGQEFTLSGLATAGDFIYIANDSANFQDYFGFAPTFVSSVVDVNGDDTVELYRDGEVVDIFGEVNVDGTGQTWDYTDGWAYRVNNTGPDGTTFMENNWTFSGPNALDGTNTNDEAENPFPIGTYMLTNNMSVPCFSLQSILSVKLPDGVFIKNTNCKNNEWCAFDNTNTSPLLLTHDHLIKHENEIKTAESMSDSVIKRSDNVVDLVSDNGRFIEIKGVNVKTTAMKF